MKIHQLYRRIDLPQQAVHAVKCIFVAFQQVVPLQVDDRHPRLSGAVVNAPAPPRGAVVEIRRPDDAVAFLQYGVDLPAPQRMVPQRDDIRPRIQYQLGAPRQDAVALGSVFPIHDGHIRPVKAPQVRQLPPQKVAPCLPHHIAHKQYLHLFTPHSSLVLIYNYSPAYRPAKNQASILANPCKPHPSFPILQRIRSFPRQTPASRRPRARRAARLRRARRLRRRFRLRRNALRARRATHRLFPYFTPIPAPLQPPAPSNRPSGRRPFRLRRNPRAPPASAASPPGLRPPPPLRPPANPTPTARIIPRLAPRPAMIK